MFTTYYILIEEHSPGGATKHLQTLNCDSYRNKRTEILNQPSYFENKKPKLRNLLQFDKKNAEWKFKYNKMSEWNLK